MFYSLREAWTTKLVDFVNRSKAADVPATPFPSQLITKVPTLVSTESPLTKDESTRTTIMPMSPREQRPSDEPTGSGEPAVSGEPVESHEAPALSETAPPSLKASTLPAPHLTTSTTPSTTFSPLRTTSIEPSTTSAEFPTSIQSQTTSTQLATTSTPMTNTSIQRPISTQNPTSTTTKDTNLVTGALTKKNQLPFFPSISLGA